MHLGILDLGRQDYCLYRSYMYRRMNMPRQAYQLRRMADHAARREALS